VTEEQITHLAFYQRSAAFDERKKQLCFMLNA